MGGLFKKFTRASKLETDFGCFRSHLNPENRHLIAILYGYQLLYNISQRSLLVPHTPLLVSEGLLKLLMGTFKAYLRQVRECCCRYLNGQTVSV
jgi:hypothetical protein